MPSTLTNVMSTRQEGTLRDPKRFAESIMARTRRARDYHDVWIAIAGDALRADYSPMMGKFRNLFQTTEIASRLGFIITLCSLYDDDGRAVSIRRYANHVWRRNTSRSEWKARFKSVSAKARRLYGLRNNYFAHVSDDTFEQNLFREAGLTYNDLSDLMTKTWSLVQELVCADGLDFSYNDTVESDLRVLFPKLKLPLSWAGNIAS